MTGKHYRLEGQCIPDYTTGIRMFLEALVSGEYGVIKSVGEIDRIGFKTVLSKGFYGVHELTDAVMDGMRDYLFIAPVHNAAYLEAIGQFNNLLPDVPKIGVFETAFHTTIPIERRIYGVPYEWYEKYGLMRMGLSRGISRLHSSGELRLRQGRASDILPSGRELLRMRDTGRQER